jgi:hypothetical protein
VHAFKIWFALQVHSVVENPTEHLGQRTAFAAAANKAKNMTNRKIFIVDALSDETELKVDRF